MTRRELRQLRNDILTYLDTMRWQWNRAVSGLKCYVDLKLGEIVISDFRVIQRPNKKAWVSPSVSRWQDKDGRTKYKPIISLPSVLRQRVDLACLTAWEKERKNGNRESA